MKIVWLLLALSLLALGISVSAVEYRTGPGINLSVRVSPGNAVVPGQSVQLSITASDKDYVVDAHDTIIEQPDDPVSLNWQASAGTLTAVKGTGNIPTQLTWTAPMKAGYYSIFITADDSGRFADDESVRKVVEITAKMDGTTIAPTVRVSATPQTIQLDKNTQSVISAKLLGENVAGKDVTFFATGGMLSATKATTDDNGVASVRLAAGPQSLGTITVAASYGNTTSTTTVEVVQRAPAPRDPDKPTRPPQFPAYQPAFPIEIDPPVLPADGHSDATVTVRLVDGRGLGIANQNVEFSVTVGRIGRRMLTDRNGYARVKLTAPDEPAQALVFAQVGAQRSYAVVRFEKEKRHTDGPPRIFLSVTPTSVFADGMSKVLVYALVLDNDGYAIANAPVDFTTTLGLLQYPRLTTDVQGQAGTYLLAPTMPGQAVVSASVGQITAASQVIFQGKTAVGGGLDIRNWNGQQTVLASEQWLYRQVHIENGQQSADTNTLMLIDATGRVVKQLDLGKNALLVTDQYGTAHGYAVENGTQAQIALLTPDGTLLRTLTINLPVGTHIVNAQYAEPAGHVVVSLANPDGTRPEVHFFSPTGDKLLTLNAGLEQLPVTALGGDGYLAIALTGGTVRVYGPQGDQVTEVRRTDGMPATQLTLGPAGEWVAVAAALGGQTEKAPVVTVFSRQGSTLVISQVEARYLAPAGKDGVLVSAPDSTRYINLASRSVTWSIPGGFERFLAVGDKGIIAGQRDPQTKALLSRIVIVRLGDGGVIGAQDLNDLREIRAVLPPNAAGQFGVLTANYAFRIPLPAGN